MDRQLGFCGFIGRSGFAGRMFSMRQLKRIALMKCMSCAGCYAPTLTAERLAKGGRNPSKESKKTIVFSVVFRTKSGYSGCFGGPRQVVRVSLGTGVALQAASAQFGVPANL